MFLRELVCEVLKSTGVGAHHWYYIGIKSSDIAQFGFEIYLKSYFKDPLVSYYQCGLYEYERFTVPIF